MCFTNKDKYPKDVREGVREEGGEKEGGKEGSSGEGKEILR